MAQIRTVLCPVDFSSLSDRELEVAIELCEAFGARLVLHHNRDLAPFAWSKAWEWEETHPPEEGVEARADRKMEELLARVPDSVRAEAVVSHGLVVPVLLHLVGSLPADLVVLGSHGWSNEDHASVAERIVECCPCPVLTIRDSSEASTPFRLRSAGGDMARVLVPTDFSKSGETAARYAFDLARSLPLRIHLLHVASGRGGAGAAVSQRRKLLAMVPEDLALRADCSVSSGQVAEELLKLVRDIDPALIVMGRHASGLFSRVFTRDHAQEMLHRASCPVLFAA